YLLSWAAGKLLRADRSTWALPHAPVGIWVFAGTSAALFVLLCAMSLAQPFQTQLPNARLLWYTVVAAAFLFGMTYPKLALRRIAAASPAPTAEPALPEDFGNYISAGDNSETVSPSLARSLDESAPDTENGVELRTPSIRWLRQAYASYLRRYYGVLSGLFLCVVSFWVILYRVAFSLYPFQVELLAPGLETQEHQVVQHVLSMLG
ncbi:MAG: hypothetical protein V2A71_02615, partial [Candidatus Eisenbacteria bacterium]